MIRKLLSLSLFIFSTNFILLSQISNLFHLDVELGFNVGTPMMKISEIPEGATGQPGFGYHPAITVEYPLNQQFSLGMGVGYSQKNGQFTSPVTGKYDVVEGVFGTSFPIPIRVNYTGIVDGKFKNTYLDFPIFINYHCNIWKFRLGYQFSKLMNSSLTGDVDVRALILEFNDVAFDESETIKSKDHAILIGAERQLSKRFSIATRFTYGLAKIMKEELEEGINPQNLYFYLTGKFRLF
jgi:hypothetical protein